MQHRNVQPNFSKYTFGALREKPLRILYCIGLAVIAALLQRLCTIPLTIGGIDFALSFWAAPVLIAGILYGPAGGILTGVLAQMLATLALAAAPYRFAYTDSAALLGLIPSLFFLRLPKRSVPSYLYLLLACVSSLVATQALLNSGILAILSGGSYWELLWPSAITAALLAPLFALAAYYSYTLYDRIVNPLNE